MSPASSRKWPQLEHFLSLPMAYFSEESGAFSVCFSSSQFKLGEEEFALSSKSQQHKAYFASPCQGSIAEIFSLKQKGRKAKPVSRKSPAAKRGSGKSTESRSKRASVSTSPKQKLPKDTFDEWLSKQAKSKRGASGASLASQRAVSSEVPKDTFEVWLAKQKPSAASTISPAEKMIPDTFDQWLGKQKPKEERSPEAGQQRATYVQDTYDEWIKNQKPIEVVSETIQSYTQVTDTFEDWMKKQVALRSQQQQQEQAKSA